MKKGKLRRRVQKEVTLSDDDETPLAAEGNNEDAFELQPNAFDALFKPNKKAAQSDTFDKKRSEAKSMFEEQAEESEDEYAGLGGASDDESENGVDEEVAKMIDEGPVDVKEGELAKFFADRDRADDEKRIDRLYKDITTGALRRKRGVGVDELSDDSDDEAAERRRRKQAEFRKMRQALLLDENVGKIGEIDSTLKT
jgi:mediator of replication checkpoint protein 1